MFCKHVQKNPSYTTTLRLTLVWSYKRNGRSWGIRIRTETTVRHTKCGRMRGMVVGEGGHSSGVLLYMYFSDTSSERNVILTTLIAAWGKQDVEVMFAVLASIKLQQFTARCQVNRSWKQLEAVRALSLLLLPEA